MAIAKTDSAPGENDHWRFLGLLTFLDPPRPDTAKTIADAKKFGVQVKMITGDHLLIARETAKALNMGGVIARSDGLPMLNMETKKKPEGLSRDYGDLCLACDGFAEVFPEHKYLIVECLRELGYKTGMTGDGVNDAPALKRADVGIAVAGATDAARAAADIVLTEEGLSTIINGIVVARKIFVRIRNFIIYRVAATIQLLMFFFIATFAFQPDEYDNPGDWPSYFQMPVLMLMLITLLNDGTLIAIGYDNVEPTEDPSSWNVPFLMFIGCVLASTACMSSLILLEDLVRTAIPFFTIYLCCFIQFLILYYMS
jgi:H+-transporting ATPase